MPRSGGVLPSVAVLHYTAPPVVGGVERVVARQAELLAERGFPVRVVVGRGTAPGRRVQFCRLPLLDSRHPRVLAVTHQLDGGRVTRAYAMLTEQIAAALRRALRSVDVCLVHNVLTLHKNLALTEALHRIAAERPALRVVAWCHDPAWANPQYHAVLHAGKPWSLLSTPVAGATYVTVSRQRQREVGAALRLPLSRIEVIPNGVDPATFLRLSPATQWLADTLHLWDQQLVLLLPVRITRRKRIEYAVRIVSELVRRELTVRLLVTGPPGAHNPGNAAYLEELLALRHALHLDEQVVFCHELPGPDGRRFVLSDRGMADLYALADALLLTSREEGFGLPLLEAALARLPVFATRLDALLEVGGDAIQTFGIDDTPAACAQRIINGLMGDRSYRLRRRALGAYTWETVMRERIVPLLTQHHQAAHR